MRLITASARIVTTLVLLLGAGCSHQAAKRTSFETLQNLRDQQCSHDLSGNCPPRESYDDYTRKRHELLDQDDGASRLP